jgi:hypothetical protein
MRCIVVGRWLVNATEDRNMPALGLERETLPVSGMRRHRATHRVH